MATSITPKLSILVNGEGSVTKLTKEISWTPMSQKEMVYYIKDTDSAIPISFSDIDALKILMILAEDNVTITITMIDTNVVTLVTDNFVITPDSTWLALVDTITVSTTSTTNIKVNINVYGA